MEIGFLVLFKIEFYGKHYLAWPKLYSCIGNTLRIDIICFKHFFIGYIHPFQLKINFLFSPSKLIGKIIKTIIVLLVSSTCIYLIPIESNGMVFYRIEENSKIMIKSAS